MQVKGTKTDEGFCPIGDRGFSVQGVDAQDAWRIVFGLAKKLSVGTKVTFEWREREGAAFPGRTGVLKWNPTESA